MNRDNNHNVIRKLEYPQVCVWPATTVLTGKPEGVSEQQVLQDFEQFLMEQLGARVQYLEEITTLPDTDAEGKPIVDTGGRIDTFFAMHQDDIEKAALLRLNMGIRWLEDVLAPSNYRSRIYPDRVRFYQTWPMDGTIIDAPTEEEEQAFQAMEHNSSQTTEEIDTTEQHTQTTTSDAQPDTLQRLVSALVLVLKPQLESMVSTIVEQKMEEADLVTQEDLDHCKFITEDEVQSEVESVLSQREVVRGLTKAVEENLDYDGLLDSDEFRSAVSDIIDSTDFQISVSTR